MPVIHSAAMLMTRCCTIQNFRGLSNEILCICVAQGAAKLPEINLIASIQEYSSTITQRTPIYAALNVGM